MLWYNHRLFLSAIAEYNDDWVLKQRAGGCTCQVKRFIENTRGGKPKGWLRELVTFAQISGRMSWREIARRDCSSHSLRSRSHDW